MPRREGRFDVRQFVAFKKGEATMDTRLEEFRKRAAEVVPRRTGRKFPSDLIAVAREYAQSRRAEGLTWQGIADELGVSMLTARRWGQLNEMEAVGFKPVRVVEPPNSPSFTVAVGSLRVEGLSFEALVALAKALS